MRYLPRVQMERINNQHVKGMPRKLTIKVGNPLEKLAKDMNKQKVRAANGV